MTDRYVVSKEPCPRCRKLGRDSKGDNLAVYSDGGTWCFACNRGTVDPSAGSLETYESEDLMEFGRAEWDKIKKLCALSKPSGNPHEGFNYRDISDDTYKVFGVINLANASGDSVAEQYYPLTQEVEGVAQLCGTKVRRVPKSFSAKGSNKALTTQLFGQSLAEKSGKKIIVIASGECDAMAAFEMLKGLGQDCPAIVSSTVGENGVKQFRAQYAFLDRFEKIIVIPDQDKAGREALANLAVALPRGKVFVVDLPKKDVNEMLSAGLSVEFLKRYRAASPYVPDGVLGSSCLFDKVVELAGLKKVPLPDFLWRLQDMLAGGFALESIVNLISGSGAGKCLAKGTPVLMADKTVKAVEDIRVGDRVMHPSGGFNTVTALGHGYDEMYEVSQSCGMSYTVNSEHILSFKLGDETVNLPIKEYLENPNPELKGWRSVQGEVLKTNISVTPVGRGEYYGFTLDGDHLFCLQDGTVTHNTTYTNELIYYWIFNSPYKVGILTMELSAPQYAQVLLSRHLEDKISNMTPEAQREFLAREDVQEKAKALFTAPDGTDRFFLIDERSNDIETMQKLLEQLIISAGCKILIIDPLQDVVASSDLAAQQQWMAWEKVIVKQYGVLIFNVCHTRKSVSGEKALSRGGQISEEMVEGSSTIIKSAKINILFNRDKLAEDPIVKNTTTIEMTKNRDNGSTGRVVEVFYDNMTHRLYDLEDYKLKHPEKFVQEVEGDINSVSEAIKGCEVVKDV